MPNQDLASNTEVYLSVCVNWLLKSTVLLWLDCFSKAFRNIVFQVSVRSSPGGNTYQNQSLKVHLGFLEKRETPLVTVWNRKK